MDTSNDIRKIATTLLIIAVAIGSTYWLTSNYLTGGEEAVDNSKQDDQGPAPVEELTKEVIKARIKTEKGDIVLDLYPKAAPKTVDNFVAKARDGYFNGLKFHRVEDWVIQGGDPLSRDESKEQLWGTGGGNIDTELSPLPFVEGALGVARGQDIKVSNDSQFFIVKKDSQFLNNQYTLFGQVTEGVEVVNGIEKGDKITSIVVE